MEHSLSTHHPLKKIPFTIKFIKRKHNPFFACGLVTEILNDKAEHWEPEKIYFKIFYFLSKTYNIMTNWVSCLPYFEGREP